MSIDVKKALKKKTRPALPGKYLRTGQSDGSRK
jgi:hypothetical protein